MAIQYPVIANGAATSSVVVVDRPSEYLVVGVPSHAALGWRLEFATTSAGPWAPGVYGDGAGLAYDGFSGAAGAFFRAAAFTSVVRLRTSGTVTGPMTATIMPQVPW